MEFVIDRKLTIRLSAIAFVVAFTAPSPGTMFLMPPSTPLVLAVLGITAIMFTVLDATPWWRSARSVARAVPPGTDAKRV